MSEPIARKIIDCLKRAESRDLSIEEIASQTKIHRNTVSKYIYGLEKEGKIIKTREVGRAKFYTIK
jgi:DNA-binding IclR family transcriptional regulator